MLRTMRRKQPRGDAVVRKVLETTLDELARVGLDRLSVPEVAERAGVHKTSIYRRWPTKEALVQAALDERLPHGQALPDAGSLEADLSALAHEVAAFLSSPRGTGVVRTVFGGSDDSAVYALAREAWAESGGAAAHRVVERAWARGDLPRDADVELLLFSMAGALLHRVFIERGPTDDAWVARLIRLMLLGVAGGRPAKPSRKRARR